MLFSVKGVAVHYVHVYPLYMNCHVHRVLLNIEKEIEKRKTTTSFDGTCTPKIYTPTKTCTTASMTLKVKNSA